MLVSDIFKKATASCDFYDFDGSPVAWMRLINSKGSDGGFFKLVDDILDNGWEQGSAIGFYSDYEITEGHHRLVAAILLGIDDIPISSWGNCFGTICAHTDESGRYDTNNGMVYFDADDLAAAKDLELDLVMDL